MYLETCRYAPLHSKLSQSGQQRADQVLEYAEQVDSRKMLQRVGGDAVVVVAEVVVVVMCGGALLAFRQRAHDNARSMGQGNGMAHHHGLLV